jgi:hypothetical protein
MKCNKIQLQAGSLQRHLARVRLVVDFMTFISENDAATHQQVRPMIASIIAKNIPMDSTIQTTLCGLRLKDAVGNITKASNGDHKRALAEFEEVFSPFAKSMEADDDSDENGTDNVPAQAGAGTPATFSALNPTLATTQNSFEQKLKIARHVCINAVVVPLMEQGTIGSEVLLKICSRIGAIYREGLMNLADSPKDVTDMVVACNERGQP